MNPEQVSYVLSKLKKNMILLCAGRRVQLCHVRQSLLYVRPFVRSSVCAVGPYSVEFFEDN